MLAVEYCLYRQDTTFVITGPRIPNVSLYIDLAVLSEQPCQTESVNHKKTRWQYWLLCGKSYFSSLFLRPVWTIGGRHEPYLFTFVFCHRCHCLMSLLCQLKWRRLIHVRAGLTEWRLSSSTHNISVFILSGSLASCRCAQIAGASCSELSTIYYSFILMRRSSYLRSFCDLAVWLPVYFSICSMYRW